MQKTLMLLSCLVLCLCCETTEQKAKKPKEDSVNTISETSLIILGTTQDAGSPQINCTKKCCADLFDHPDPTRKVVSLGLIDTESKKTYIFEATPDIGDQLDALQQVTPFETHSVVDGIFLTHAHIGHYTGLMYLGKEAMDAKNIPIFSMPRMAWFLENNGPWSQLIKRNNIETEIIKDNVPVNLSTNIEVIPMQVPHRDEFSETAAYKIVGPNKSAIFIPDIDKWDQWEKDIIEEIASVDYAFLDATFFDGVEINNRDIKEIPHPFVIESFAKFESLPHREKSKIYFIHFNHTNPLLNPQSLEYKKVYEKGFRVAKYGEVFAL